MSTLTAPVEDGVRPFPVGKNRLFSLDLFRGITIAAMILVNNQNGERGFHQLLHARWNGWTLADLVFPFFLFIVGVSLVFSFQSRLKRGETRGRLVLHTLRRSAVLFVIGLALNGMASLQPATWRIPGVLQRTAVVYAIASLIFLFSETRARVAWMAALTIGYWIIMRYLPVPGHGVPGVNVALLHPDHNLAAYLDRKLMLGHLWQKTRDPEGILSTIPAVATALCGVLTGEWLRSDWTSQQKLAGMFCLGTAGVIAGQIWSLSFPINKNLWTSSYVLFTAGLALIVLALCYWICDIGEHQGLWSTPLLIFGTNAITAYVVSELLGGWFGLRGICSFHDIARHSARMASLLHSLVVLALSFLPVWWMYRRKIFLKV
jgi:predicted acyltransferase